MQKAYQVEGIKAVSLIPYVANKGDTIYENERYFDCDSGRYIDIEEKTTTTEDLYWLILLYIKKTDRFTLSYLQDTKTYKFLSWELTIDNGDGGEPSQKSLSSHSWNG